MLVSLKYQKREIVYIDYAWCGKYQYIRYILESSFFSLHVPLACLSFSPEILNLVCLSFSSSPSSSSPSSPPLPSLRLISFTLLLVAFTLLAPAVLVDLPWLALDLLLSSTSDTLWRIWYSIGLSGRPTISKTGWSRRRVSNPSKPAQLDSVLTTKLQYLSVALLISGFPYSFPDYLVWILSHLKFLCCFDFHYLPPSTWKPLSGTPNIPKPFAHPPGIPYLPEDNCHIPLFPWPSKTIQLIPTKRIQLLDQYLIATTICRI